MTSLCEVRRLSIAAAISAAIAFAGCSRAPESPPKAESKPAAPAGHDDDHVGHGHAAVDHDHADHDHVDHDHADHDHPRTLPEGVAHLATLAASVKQHLAAESRDDADAAVHGLGHLLEDLQGLVRTSDLAGEAKAAATKALDDLFECFDALDAALHAEPGSVDSPASVHAAAAKRIEAAIGALKTAIEPGQAPAAAGDDPAAAIIREAEARRRKEQE